MVKIIIGEMSTYNRYHLDDIVNKYYKSLIIVKNTMKSCKNILNKISRPLLGDRLLLNITDNEIFYLDLQNNISLLEDYQDHPYLDIVWTIGKIKGRIDFVKYSSLDIILLKQTYREDIKFYLNSIINDNDKTKYILNKINYSWKTLQLYTDKIKLLCNEDKLTYTGIDSLITVRNLMNLQDVFIGILLKKKTYIREYYRYIDRYSKDWFIFEFTNALENVLKFKDEYYRKKSIKISDLFNKNSAKGINRIVTHKDINIYMVYSLLTLLRTSLFPIESYICAPEDIKNNIQFIFNE